MTVEIIASEIMVCSDCLEAIEFTDEELGYTPNSPSGLLRPVLTSCRTGAST